MITQVGIEILNKIKAGIGSITVTRIVAGSGRVSASQLFQQTELSGTTKPMVITQRNSNDTGSEISMYITNEGFTESFNLNQIGVFVSHPDYEGEHLYHISQCEAEGVDVIPVFGETPVTFGYSLFLEHGNSDSINITVDLQGMVRIDEYTAFKGDIKPGNLIEVDSEGNLKDTGRKPYEIPNPNLLNNWYFLNPVNRKNGYIVPPGTPYYSDPELTAQVGTTTLYTPITQITTTYGTVTVSNKVYYASLELAVKGYSREGISIDNWRLTSGPNSYVLVEDDGVTFGNTGSAIEYVQHNTWFNPVHAIGKRLTLSALTFSGQLLTATTKAEYNGEVNWGMASIAVSGSSSLFIASNGTNFFGVQMTIEPKKSLKLKAVKLEFGTQQTLAHKDDNGNWVLNDVPNFAEEMAKCAQFDLTTGNYIGFNFVSTPTGGTVKGTLTLKSANNGSGALQKHHSETVDSGTELVDFDKDGNKASVVITAHEDPKDGGVLLFMYNGVGYKLYGEHNKHLISTSVVAPATVE